MIQPSQSEQRQEPDTRPIYNIKAVTEATGLPAATLRAWERRYGALTPVRTQSGYRLYSARDIAVLRWLKARLDEGVSISQAITLLNHRHQGEQPRQAVERRQESWQGLGGSRDTLLSALLGFEETQADRVLEEAFSVYGIEAVLEHVIAPALALVGDMWHAGKTTIAVEHFASNYLRRKLDAIVNAVPRLENGPLIILGCAPEDWHELGLLLIHLLLRRRGLNSLYLGQNLPVLQFVDEIKRLQPVMVIIAATTEASAPGLVALADAVQSIEGARPLFGYGGRVFNQRPELRSNVPGIFLGESARAAVEYVAALVAEASGAGLSSGLPVKSAGA